MANNLFSGKDRIEMCEALGRPIRKGEPKELAVSDYKRVTQALESKDAESAKNYLSVHFMYMGMNSTFLEWCVALPYYISKESDDKEQEITKESYELFLESIKQDEKKNSSDAATVLKEILHPDSISKESISKFREQQKSNEPTLANTFLEKPVEIHTKLMQSIDNGNFDEAKELFPSYFRYMQMAHDLCGEFVSSYATTVQKHFDQEVAGKVAQQGLESCALLQGYWDLVASLDSETLAAFLTEHMRGHFSGENREGAIEVIEEEDKYRLVFGLCGTGGALRQAKAKSLQNYEKASPETWNLKNKVPSYCAHCAKNEITSIQKMGYPAWVTEFDSDPNKPCGWTVYKDPKNIPEKYFERVGFTKDELKFKK